MIDDDGKFLNSMARITYKKGGETRRGSRMFFGRRRRIAKYPAMFVVNDESLSQHRL
jgi:hypothetical protein